LDLTTLKNDEWEDGIEVDETTFTQSLDASKHVLPYHLRSIQNIGMIALMT
jgi:hypothetical protein